MRPMCSACPEEFDYCIVFGCIEGHIKEIYFCAKHAMIWDEAYRRTLLCPVSTCNKVIEAYEHCLYMEVR